MSVIDFTAFLDDLATASGQVILPFFRSALPPEDKGRGGPFDPVTEADRAAEAVMRRLIQASFPEHGIVGEEFAPSPAAEGVDYVWVLDPIDGTKAFIAGLPVWGTLIGLMRGGRPVYGMMHQPFVGERFSGDGGSALYRGPAGERRLRTRRCASLKEATLSATSPRMFEAEALDAFERVEARARFTRFGCDCYAYSLLAAGHLDVVIETGLKAVDIAPLIPIIEGAGGVVTGWDGGPAQGGGAVVAVGDPRLHAQVLELLAPTRSAPGSHTATAMND